MRDSFYPQPNAFLSQEQFMNCFQEISCPITEEDIGMIFKDLRIEENGKIELKQFFDKLSCWKDFLEKARPEVIANLNEELIEVIISSYDIKCRL